MTDRSSTTTSSSSISVFTLLGVAFIILKLTGVIHWSWWLVTLPLWGGLALFLAVALVVALVGGGVVLAKRGRK